MGGDGVRELPPRAPTQMEIDVRDLERDMDAMKKGVALIAEYKKAAYDEYINAGFTPYQALELCKFVSHEHEAPRDG